MMKVADALPLSGAVFWLEEALAAEDQQGCPPLVSDVTADVCIVGGGYLGLWTAIELRELAPDLTVVLVEAEGCGLAASGRNGGQMSGWHDELDVLIRLYGVDEGLRLAERSSWAIDRVVDFCDEHGIRANARRHGMTKAVVSKYQYGKWNAAMRACDAHGRGHLLTEVDGAELRRRTGSPKPMAGVTQTDAGTVQPATLARGLRRVALEMGVKIYEGSPMTGLDRGKPNRVRTSAGSVTSEKVVLALGAWMGRFPELRRAFVPIGSSMVVTEPLGDKLLAHPFANGEGIGDLRLSVHHMQITADGRLAFGRGGGPLGPAGRVTASVLHDPRTIRSIIKDVRAWFPDLADACITHAWSGAVDRSPSHLPFIGQLGDHGTIHYASGISGQGVAQCSYLGRVLGRTVLELHDADTRSPMTHGPTAFLPPEPARSVGGAVLRATVEWVENKQEDGVPLNVNKVLKKLISTTTPRALEPRLWRSDSNVTTANSNMTSL